MDYECVIRKHEILKGPYRRIVFEAPGIVAEAKPGQFVHVAIPNAKERILRRPFSICSVDRKSGLLTIVYKIVGSGTEALQKLPVGAECQIMGPQGNGYSVPEKDETSVFIAGGYGAAATLFAAQEAASKRRILIAGARTSGDLILLDEYEAAGVEVLPATNDGSAGTKGMVTDVLENVADKLDNAKIYACGPMPMLLAVGKFANGCGIACELSLDERMCCGVGACFACVVKVADETSESGWRFSRSCSEGPVYDATEVYYG